MNITMRKLLLGCGIVVLAAGGSVLAQKPIVIIGPPAPFNQTISIQDDASGSFMVLDTGSGKYEFTRCADGFTISGVGFVKTDGCSIFLEDVQSDHRVVASVNECNQQGQALVETFAPNTSRKGAVGIKGADGTPFKLLLSDKNMNDNLMDCLAEKV